MSDLLLSEDEILLKNTVSDYSKNELAPRAAGYDESALFPWDNVSGIGDLGLFGLTIPEEYGGSGGTTRQLAIAAEEIAKGCAATSVVYIAHHILLVSLGRINPNHLSQIRYPKETVRFHRIPQP
jgi:alkylation response protein AidB-like acyl-CoA dehydrogenase